MFILQLPMLPPVPTILSVQKSLNKALTRVLTINLSTFSRKMIWLGQILNQSNMSSTLSLFGVQNIVELYTKDDLM